MKNKEYNLEALIKSLKDLDVPELDSALKSRVKMSLMNGIKSSDYVPSGYLRLVTWIKETALLVQPSRLLRMRVKESFYAKIQVLPWWSFRRTSIRLLSSAMVFALLVTSVFFFGFGTQTIQAQSLSRITAFSGEVFVVRDGKRIPVDVGMSLWQNDLIETSIDGSATVVYHDDSLTRLSPNTRLSITRLAVSNETSDVTDVQLKLEKGNVWTYVPVLMNIDSSFAIEVSDKKVEVEKRASFNIAYHEGQEPEVEVFNSIVYVASNDGQTKPVINGYKAALTNGVEVSPLDEDEKSLDWVQKNLSDDRDHAALIASEIFEDADEISEINEFVAQENEFEALEIEERINKRKAHFDKLLEDYSLLISQGRSEEAAERLVLLHEIARQLLDDFVAYAQFDSQKASDLRVELNKSLNLHKRSLSLIAPNDEAEDLVNEVRFDLADTDEAKQKLGFERTTNVLEDAVDALGRGNVDEFKGLLNEYNNELESLKQASNNGLLEALNRADTFANALQSDVESNVTSTDPVVSETNPVIQGSQSYVTPVPDSSYTEESEQILPPEFQLSIERDIMLGE